MQSASYRGWTINTDHSTIENINYLLTLGSAHMQTLKNILIARQKGGMSRALTRLLSVLTILQKHAHGACSIQRTFTVLH